jgi:multiple sugar transport system substrate-binding protein
MSDHSSERTTRSYTRKEVLRGAAGTGAALGLAPILAACGGSSSGGSSAGGSSGGSGPITIGSFSDPAMVPFRDVFLKKYKQETGNVAHYNETNYDAWYQNSKNDGLQKTGAYDIYVMDDNWVPEFAASGIVQSLDKLGLKVNPDILQKGLEQGYWPPKSGPRLKAFASDTPQLYSLVIIDDVEMLYYNSDYFKSAPQTWDDIYAVAKTTKPPLYGWTARGVAGNPIVQTYLPLLNSYGGNFVNDDWSPGFAGPEGVGALERLFSFIPYMPSGVAAFDTDQETAVFLQGHATAMTEYTGTAHGVVQGRGEGRLRGHAVSGEERSGHRHVHLRHRLGRSQPGRRGRVPGVVHVQQGAAGVRGRRQRGRYRQRAA